MANIATPYSGLLTPDSTENVDVPADLLQLANSFDAKLIGFFVDIASRDAAAASFIASGKKLFAYVYTSGFFVYNGTAWENLGNVGPLHYSTSTGASGNFSNMPQTPTNWATANWTFTPTRTGWAEFGFDADCATVVSGFLAGYFHTRVSFNGGASWATLADTLQILQGDARTVVNGYRSWGNQKLNQGVPVSLALDVSSFVAAGTWMINQFTWHVVQQ